jgi:hypothetical protein
MVAKKSKQKPVSVWKSILVISAIILAVIALLFVWQYFINRPNYYDLKREYSKLTIPSNWKLVNRDDNKGVLGLFCWGIDDSSCPSISESFVSNEPLNSSLDMSVITNIATRSGYDIKTIDVKNCIDNNDVYVCGIKAVKTNDALVINIGKNSSSEKSITILLGQKSGVGIN